MLKKFINNKSTFCVSVFKKLDAEKVLKNVKTLKS